MNSIRFISKATNKEEIHIKKFVSTYCPVLNNSAIDIHVHLGDTVDLLAIKSCKEYKLFEEYLHETVSESGKEETRLHILSFEDAEKMFKDKTAYKLIKIDYYVQDSYYNEEDAASFDKYTPEINVKKFNLWEFLKATLGKDIFNNDLNPSLKNLYQASLYNSLAKTNFIVFYFEELK